MIATDPSLLISTAAPRTHSGFSPGIYVRLAALILLFTLEVVVTTLSLDTQALDGRSGLIGVVGQIGPYVLQSVIVFACVFVALGHSMAKGVIPVFDRRLRSTALEWRILGLHGLAVGLFAWLSVALFLRPPGPSPTAATVIWLSAAAAMGLTGVCFFFPLTILRDLLIVMRRAGAYAAGAAIFSPALVVASGTLWKPASAITFHLVQLLLRPFVSGVVALPATKTIGTSAFSIQIAPGCSGLEGMGLVMAFSGLWLWFFRREFRFPTALLLIPAGMAVAFLLNAARIGALILIGNAGARSIALEGFHSQAGWIAFNAVALGIAYSAQRISWLSSAPREVHVVEREESRNPAVPYLLPFLAILAASMISIATSGSFESMYPLRFFAAVGVFVALRRNYRPFNWRISWAAPVFGVLVYVIWISIDRTFRVSESGGMPATLAAWPSWLRAGWLSVRVLAAVVTVPIAEELAFRGFLVRRLMASDFESVGFQRFSFTAVLISSIAFGLLHGDRWLAGIAAGISYACAQKARGNFADAVVAHAITNALIAATVLWGGYWRLW